MTVTPNRTVRVPDNVWAHAQQTAQGEGTTVSAYIVMALRRWNPKAQVEKDTMSDYMRGWCDALNELTAYQRQLTDARHMLPSRRKETP